MCMSEASSGVDSTTARSQPNLGRGLNPLGFRISRGTAQS
jgi:hypothetical protein